MAAATAAPAWRAPAPLVSSQTTTTTSAVRVDNWGNFLAQRIQALYEKQEHCDLTLRFPRCDFKAHSLILHACTPFFTSLLKGKSSGHKILKMPPQISADAMAVILKFVYTGRLERPYTHDELYRTAKLLKLQILIRLLEAQRTGRTDAVNGVRPPLPAPVPPYRPLLGRPPGLKRTRAVFQPTNSQIAQKRTSSLVRAADPPTDARPSRFELPETDALALRLPVIDTGGSRATPPAAAAAATSTAAAAATTDSKETLFETLRQTPVKRPSAVHVNGGELKRPRADGQQGEQDITTLKEYYEEQRRRAQLLAAETRAGASTAPPAEAPPEPTAAPPAVSAAGPTTPRPILKQEPAPTGSGQKKRVQFSESVPLTVSLSEDSSGSGHELVTELLRQHPELLRGGQNVKVRLVSSVGGQSRAELITVKPGPAGSGDPPLDTPLSCSLCARAGQQQQFWWADEMVKHFQAEHADASAIDLNTLSCTSCEQSGDPKDFASVEDYFTHLKQAHETRGVGGSRSCSLCSFSSPSRLHFMYHEYTRHRITPPRFITFPKCERCNFEAMTEPDLALHRQRQHKVIKEYKCKDCDATFPTIGHLEQHMRRKGCRPQTDLRKRVDQWKCEFCGMSFSRCYNLKAHLRSVHRNVSEAMRGQKLRPSEPVLKQEPAVAAAEARLDPSSEAESMSTVASSVAASLSLAVDGEYMALPDGVVPVEDEHGQISYIALRPAEGATAGAAVVEVTQYTMPVMVRAGEDAAAAADGAGSSADETVLPDLCLVSGGAAVQLPPPAAEQQTRRRGQMAGLVSSSRIMVSGSPPPPPEEEEEEQPQLYQHPETGQLYTAVRDASGTTTLVPHTAHGVHVITSDHQQVVLSGIEHMQQAAEALQHTVSQQQYEQAHLLEAEPSSAPPVEHHEGGVQVQEAILGVESSHDSYRAGVAGPLAELAAVAADAGHLQVTAAPKHQLHPAVNEQLQVSEGGHFQTSEATGVQHLQQGHSGHLQLVEAEHLQVSAVQDEGGQMHVPAAAHEQRLVAGGGHVSVADAAHGEPPPEEGGAGAPLSYMDGGQVQQLVHGIETAVSEEVVVGGDTEAPDPGDAWEEVMPASATATDRIHM